MAEQKKYYWLKLKENFFDDDTMSFIEDQENGKEYCLFYLKLCLKALKTNGKLIRVVGEFLVPYDIHALSRMTNTDVDTVRVAMDLFKKVNIISILENGEIYLNQLNEMTGSETDKACIMRKLRAVNNGIVNDGNNVTKMLPKRYLDVTQSIDIRDNILDKEINIKKENNILSDVIKEKKFEKPTLEMVIVFFSSKNQSEIEAKKYYNYYESNGWMVGKNKMLNVEASIDYWISKIKGDKKIKEEFNYQKQSKGKYDDL